MRDFKLATGLLILYGIMTVIRQVAEPKIIGNSLGLHPLLMLFATYAGLCLFGIWGIILGPAVALLIKTYLGETAEPVNQ
jgi:predicted PurR-regulated permease PerM